MSIRLPNGLWADTGVAAETKSAQFLESEAGQRNARTPEYFSNPSATVGWSTLWVGATPTISVSPSFDAVLMSIQSWDEPGGGVTWPLFGQGSNDANGWALSLPNDSPIISPPSDFTWSCDATGSPYQLSNAVYAQSPSGAPHGNIGSPSHSPLDSYFFQFGKSVSLQWRNWFTPQSWSGGGFGGLTPNLSLNDFPPFSYPVNGMNDDLAGTLTIGDIVLTFSMASGWSGTGITANLLTGIAPNRNWTAIFTHTFTNPYQISMSMGPMSWYASNSPVKQGGGSIQFALT